MPLSPYPASLTPKVKRRPELLAPVGDDDALRAALAAGADAVYFGLDDGFNARARATNFSVERLPTLVAQAHRAGARAYLTTNTVLFEVEVPIIERLLEAVARAGVDALIVQDPAVALLARAICPAIELHASTQMTISSAMGARFATSLGMTRVVVPRELSVAEIAHFAEHTDVELEVFIHGAICMAWSGQCLTSEAWGGRSANRGKCAQACRMPYELLVDDEVIPQGEAKYLLSAKDLAGHRAIPALMEIGVHTLKVEGRLKGPAYVKTAVEGLRRWIDAVDGGLADTPKRQNELARDVALMSLSYSRGFTDGFLGGTDHQALVDGRFPKHRGLFLGEVTRVDKRSAWVRSAPRDEGGGAGDVPSPLPRFEHTDTPDRSSLGSVLTPTRGMGIVFDQGRPQDQNEPGGPLFDVEETHEGWRLTFGRPGPDLRRVNVGDRVWITGDSQLEAAARKALAQTPDGRVALTATATGREGEPLRVVAHAGHATVSVESEATLQVARRGGIDEPLLRSKLGALGGTPFRLTRLTVDVPPGLFVPVSALKRLRRELVAALTPQVEHGREREVIPGPHADALRARLASAERRPYDPGEARLVPLVRTFEQLEAVIDAGIGEVELDWMEMVGFGKAVKRARAAKLKVTAATVRVHKPGEEGFDRRVEKLAPDAVLVRHWGAVMHFAELGGASDGLEVHGDFSLNVTNSLTAHHLLNLGLDTVTAAHDLDEVQLLALLDHVPPERVTVTVHHHIPTFHTEHCSYAANLSDGRSNQTCGRPCDHHRIKLRDHLGHEHPVIVDVGCRNTVFNAQAQSASHLVPRLIARGVRRLRCEFVWETYDEARTVLDAYVGLIAGTLTADEVHDRVGAHEQFGVTSGTMEVLKEWVSS